MSYDINDYSGYVINAKTLLKGSTDSLKELRKLYPPKGSQSWDWIAPCSAIQSFLQEFVESEIHQDLNIEITGSWYGDFISTCPFKKDEAYVVFQENQLVDEKRKSGKSDKKESKLFVCIKSFMEEHGIPQDSVKYEEWRCGG